MEIGIPKDFQVCRQQVGALSTNWAINAMNLHEAHAQGFTGKGIKIAILDTGENLEHPALPSSDKSIDWHSRFYTTSIDGNGHGSGVKYCAFSGAPDAELFMIGKVLGNNGGGSFSGVEEGVSWCEVNKPDIVVMSLGAHHSANHKALNRALKRLYDLGVLVFVASGNAGGKVGYPANLETVIAVGAIDYNEDTAEFQNEGTELQFVAPGKQVKVAWKGKTWLTVNGTSFGNPYAASFAACLLQEYKKINPEYTVEDFIKVMSWNCKDLGLLGKDNKSGFGLPTFGLGNPWRLSKDKPILEPKTKVPYIRKWSRLYWILVKLGFRKR